QSLQEKRKHPDEIASQKMRQEIAALRKNNGELAKKLAAAKRELAAQGTKSEGVDRPKKAKKDTPKRPGSITVRYDENSAANLEGREKVLRWIEDRMKEGAKNFSIEGFANDSEYPETCGVIANNRAKYLAGYLVLKGIPDSSLSISASVSDAEGERGRSVVVSTDGK